MKIMRLGKKVGLRSDVIELYEKRRRNLRENNNNKRGIWSEQKNDINKDKNKNTWKYNTINNDELRWSEKNIENYIGTNKYIRVQSKKKLINTKK